MSPLSPEPETVPEIELQAADWLMRQDRGLTPVEQDALSQWLAADSRHGQAMKVQRWGWEELDRIAGVQAALSGVPDPDLLVRGQQRRTRRTRLFWFVPLAAAAAVAILIGLRRPASVPERVVAMKPSALAAPCEQQVLEDGSVVDLNRGAAIDVQFAPRERRVMLVRGEANFTVASDSARPFIVIANGVEIRAVGTVFNVRMDADAVEVLVVEGKVKVADEQTARAIRDAGGASDAGVGAVGVDGQEHLDLSAGQRATVSLARAAAPPQVVTLGDAQLARRLAWQPRMMDFTDAPLAEIVDEFNLRNEFRIVLGSEAVGALRLSATFRSDNVEGFIRLMETDFGLRADWSEKEVRLSGTQNQ